MDAQAGLVTYRPSELEHHYGDGVHLLADPLALTLLGRLCAKGVVQPEVGRLVESLYRSLAHVVVSAEFPRQPAAVPTRMIDVTPLGIWRGEIIAADTPTVVVALARAGLLPAAITYDFLHQLLAAEVIRQDHLFLGRETNREGRVTGSALAGAKVGGPVEQSLMLIPDPMGATGNTVDTALRHYQTIGAGVGASGLSEGSGRFCPRCRITSTRLGARWPGPRSVSPRSPRSRGASSSSRSPTRAASPYTGSAADRHGGDRVCIVVFHESLRDEFPDGTGS